MKESNATKNHTYKILHSSAAISFQTLVVGRDSIVYIVLFNMKY